MNPFATGTSAGHAPRRSDGEHEKRERAENHGSSREDERGKTARKEIYARIRRREEKEGRRREQEGSEREKEEARRDRKVARQNCAATAPTGDLYRIISPSECLHF